MQLTSRKLALGSVLRILSLIATSVCSFFLTPFIVHSLGDKTYGLWALVGAFVGYYGLLDLGLTSAVTRYVGAKVGAKSFDSCKEIYNTSLRIYFFLAACCIGISLLLAAVAPVLGHSDNILVFRELIVILGVNAALGFPLRAVSGALNACGRYDVTSGFELLTLACRTFGMVLVLKHGFGILALGGVAAGANLPSLGMQFWYAHRSFSFLTLDVRIWSLSAAKDLLAYGVFSFITQIADVLRFQLDLVVVSAFVGLSAVTHFSIASALTNYLLGIIMAAMGILQSVFAQKGGAGDFQGISQTFLFGTRLSILTTNFVSFGLLAWGRALIERWMGHGYVDAYPILAVLVIGCTFALWQNPSVNLFYALGKHRVYAVQTVGEGIANLLLSVLFVRHYGPIGVALGTSLPMAATKLVFQPIYAGRIARIRYGTYMRVVFGTVLRSTVGLIGPAIITYFMLQPTYLSLIVVSCVSFVMYAVVLLVIEFNSAEVSLLKAIVVPRDKVGMA